MWSRLPQSVWFLACAMWVSGCIEKSASGADSDNGSRPAAESDSSITNGSSNMTDAATSSTAVDGFTAMPERDAADDDPPPPVDMGTDREPRDPEEDLCSEFCVQVDTCLLADCPGLEAVLPPNFCRGWCFELDDDTLREYASAECVDFLEIIYAGDDELASFCSDAPIPDECGAICEAADRCGFEEAGCLPVCRDLRPEQRECMLAAEGCEALFSCVDGGRDRDRPDPEDLCQPYCQRRSQCVFDECAPGTLPQGATRACIAECEVDPPALDEFRSFFEQRCDEAISGIREEDPELDARCSADPEASCETVCEERVVPCMGINQDACVADCQNWDRANQLCVVSSRRCVDVNACFGDPEGQQLCRRTCDYLQNCLEEACPPRSIPPTITDGCTAGCLDDPPSIRETEEWESLSCREIREVVYRGNRELRPICEGGRDFRPTPEECVAFCDNALGQCLGVGGRNFCLAGCASLTREQYGCALEAQGNCEVIDMCLAQE